MSIRTVDLLFGPVIARDPETPVEDLRNALMVLRLTDPFSLAPLTVRDNLTAIEARVMKAIVKLEAK